MSHSGLCADKGTTRVPLVVLLAIGSFIWSDTPLWEQDIANLSPISTEKKERDQALRNELEVPDVRDLIVVEGSSEEEVLQRSETLALASDPLVLKGELAGYDLAARYLPSRKTQQARQAALPDRETLSEISRQPCRDCHSSPACFSPSWTQQEKPRRRSRSTSRRSEGLRWGSNWTRCCLCRRDAGCGSAVAWRHGQTEFSEASDAVG